MMKSEMRMGDGGASHNQMSKISENTVGAGGGLMDYDPNHPSIIEELLMVSICRFTHFNLARTRVDEHPGGD